MTIEKLNNLKELQLLQVLHFNQSRAELKAASEQRKMCSYWNEIIFGEMKIVYGSRVQSGVSDFCFIFINFVQ